MGEKDKTREFRHMYGRKTVRYTENHATVAISIREHVSRQGEHSDKSNNAAMYEEEAVFQILCSATMHDIGESGKAVNCQQVDDSRTVVQYHHRYDKINDVSKRQASKSR